MFVYGLIGLVTRFQEDGDRKKLHTSQILTAISNSFKKTPNFATKGNAGHVDGTTFGRRQSVP